MDSFDILSVLSSGDFTVAKITIVDNVDTILLRDTGGTYTDDELQKVKKLDDTAFAKWLLHQKPDKRHTISDPEIIWRASAISTLVPQQLFETRQLDLIRDVDTNIMSSEAARYNITKAIINCPNITWAEGYETYDKNVNYKKRKHLSDEQILDIVRHLDYRDMADAYYSAKPRNYGHLFVIYKPKNEMKLLGKRKFKDLELFVKLDIQDRDTFVGAVSIHGDVENDIHKKERSKEIAKRRKGIKNSTQFSAFASNAPYSDKWKSLISSCASRNSIVVTSILPSSSATFASFSGTVKFTKSEYNLDVNLTVSDFAGFYDAPVVIEIMKLIIDNVYDLFLNDYLTYPLYIRIGRNICQLNYLPGDDFEYVKCGFWETAIPQLLEMLALDIENV